ncbi:MAG: bifunctional (p)ppGpp synthetase/guanosine-3',5'-bis(diphosphate) 3'-pyrophosphohydrolase, partial [Burkholderiales bacterium]
LVAEGRTVVERALQREGRTALPLEALASRLGFATPDALFAAVAREEVGPRMLESAIRGEAAASGASQTVADAGPAEALPPLRRATADGRAGRRSDVLVVGVDFLMTQLARCCRPLPPDPIAGFVTRGRGVSIHRSACRGFRTLAARMPERVLRADWGARGTGAASEDGQGASEDGNGASTAPAAVRGSGAAGAGSTRLYPAEVTVRLGERRGALRDLLDALARDKVNVVGVNTRSKGSSTTARLTLEVADREELQRALAAIRSVAGVLEAVRA